MITDELILASYGITADSLSYLDNEEIIFRLFRGNRNIHMREHIIVLRSFLRLLDTIGINKKMVVLRGMCAEAIADAYRDSGITDSRAIRHYLIAYDIYKVNELTHLIPNLMLSIGATLEINGEFIRAAKAYRVGLSFFEGAKRISCLEHSNLILRNGTILTKVGVAVNSADAFDSAKRLFLECYEFVDSVGLYNNKEYCAGKLVTLFVESGDFAAAERWWNIVENIRYDMPPLRTVQHLAVSAKLLAATGQRELAGIAIRNGSMLADQYGFGHQKAVLQRLTKKEDN